ncbi:MAG TPA: ATPase, T2SS/T4P/T4SS family [Kiritimatiellia bacterium]|jgi:type II secretion system protein E|nr:Flp pilus assembly complex ATPase component TadA [Kiritimatiellia bacterium]HOD99632.1 ATPase, T2SS/T4P/T4SS family [Kiritimatiellia bacterium]HOE36407.1 ATPase, T2SS/T4P/T4SS family [Kiritimatiellia bacterium]HOR74370.1 ATPase, T2SS/T4P/T4SS family [Kiritimatiellia bacterium]HOU58578.1 ATPase, T2SS/T4P/T4SS family [Kiritimatiellia bacterium]
MAGTASSRLGALLAATGLFTPEQIEELVGRQREDEGVLTATVVAREYAREDAFLAALAKAMEIPFVRVGDKPIPGEILEKIPTKAVFQSNVIPVGIENGVLRVATSEPFRPGLADALRLAAGMRIKFALSPTADIEKATKKFYGVGADTLDRLMADNQLDLDADSGPAIGDLSNLDQDASVVKFVNQVIWECHHDRGTDIHIEPMETDLRIRYRIDGVLHPTPLPPQMKRFQSAIISRIKVMAGMDIAEKRLPQDGRISLRIKGEEIDVRVSTMPTVYGESVSLRLLMRSSGMFGMDKLGLFPDDAATLNTLIRRPHGILLVTGPTGSGKSTSLYAWLHTINSVDKRILTVEDPIEYEMAGINQIQMKPEIGLTFAVGLRHILRQDPDVIMVGEIRDQETADIAIRAALTGHLVFSTLHTNDAAGGITRLVDMGIEPFLVSSSLEALVAQRLVRRLCPACKRPWTVDVPFLESLGFPISKLLTGTIYEPVGCEECRGTGYAGRTGIYEILVMTDAIRQMVVERRAASEIKQHALEHDMHTLRMDGWRKVLAGITTLEEVIRVTSEDEA